MFGIVGATGKNNIIYFLVVKNQIYGKGGNAVVFIFPALLALRVEKNKAESQIFTLVEQEEEGGIEIVKKTQFHHQLWQKWENIKIRVISYFLITLGVVLGVGGLIGLFITI